jgi:hypothetical protein
MAYVATERIDFRVETVRGDALVLDIYIKDVDPMTKIRTLRDVTGCTFLFTAKRVYGTLNDDTEAVLIASSTGASPEIAIVNAITGFIRITSITAQTATKTLANVETLLNCDVQMKTAVGQIDTVSRGTWLVRPEVTQTA